MFGIFAGTLEIACFGILMIQLLSIGIFRVILRDGSVRGEIIFPTFGRTERFFCPMGVIVFLMFRPAMARDRRPD